MLKKENKGITLVALVITIIILLILAAISIQALTNTGLFGKAEDAKEKTIKAQLKEEIEMAIQEIQVEEIPKGNNVTLESLANGQLVSKLKDITAELGTNEITGEYKDYDYTIDSNLKVEIGGKITGVKPEGTAKILTTNYMFEGDGTVQIKVTASISEGTIARIDAPSGATLLTDTSATEKIYTVSKNGTYVFSIVGDSKRKKNVVAKVENILDVPQIKVNEITKNSFKINVENNYPEGIITEYKYYVGDTIKSQETTDKNYIVTGLEEGTEYGNIKVIAYINSSISKESNIENITTIGGITYSWDELSAIAKAISNDSMITNDTEEAQVTVNGETKTLKVGDTKKLDGKKVRILGFNHDTLTDENAYGGKTATGKAGISFEYVDFIDISGTGIGEPLKSDCTKPGGWGSCELRIKLNVKTYNSLSIKDKIKQVNKEYIQTYDDATSKTSIEDYLWLLSCGEIWNSGYDVGVTRGYTIGTEGSQYKYYKLGNQIYNLSTGYAKKPDNDNTADAWWLRSISYVTNDYFCLVKADGNCGYTWSSHPHLVAPGFCI